MGAKAGTDLASIFEYPCRKENCNVRVYAYMKLYEQKAIYFNVAANQTTPQSFSSPLGLNCSAKLVTLNKKGIVINIAVPYYPLISLDIP